MSFLLFIMTSNRIPDFSFYRVFWCVCCSLNLKNFQYFKSSLNSTFVDSNGYFLSISYSFYAQCSLCTPFFRILQYFKIRHQLEKHCCLYRIDHILEMRITSRRYAHKNTLPGAPSPYFNYILLSSSQLLWIFSLIHGLYQSKSNFIFSFHLFS